MTVVGELSDSVGAAPAAALGGSRTRGLLILHGLAHSMVVVEEEHIEARALSAPCGRHVVVGSGCPSTMTDTWWLDLVATLLGSRCA